MERLVKVLKSLVGGGEGKFVSLGESSSTEFSVSCI